MIFIHSLMLYKQQVASRHIFKFLKEVGFALPFFLFLSPTFP